MSEGEWIRREAAKLWGKGHLAEESDTLLVCAYLLRMARQGIVGNATILWSIADLRERAREIKKGERDAD
jgi:hypothetical protein